MSNTFEDVKKTLQSAAGKAVKKTGEIYESTKLSLNISAVNSDVDELYKQIGKSVYTHYTDDDFSIDDISALCEAVDAKKNELAELQNKMAELKNVAVCPECGATVSNDSTFCAKCGSKL